MKRSLIIIVLPILILAFQNCTNGFVALGPEDLETSELTSTLPEAPLNPNEPEIPDSVTDLLSNSSFTFTNNAQFYTVAEAYSTVNGIGLSAYLSTFNQDNIETVNAFQRIDLFEINGQLTPSVSDYTLPVNHEYMASRTRSDGGQSVTTVLDNGAVSWFYNRYDAASTLSCTGEIVNGGPLYSQILENGNNTYVFFQQLLGNLFGVGVVAFDNNCMEVNRFTLTAEDARDLILMDADIAGNNLYMSFFTATTLADGSITRQPIVASFTTAGVLQTAQVYSSAAADLSGGQIEVVGNDVILAGVLRVNEFASRNLYHAKLNGATLQAQMGATTGFASNETISGVLTMGNSIAILGTMEHPMSTLESVFYYRLDPATMTVNKQLVFDTPSSDTFNSAAFLQGKYLGITLNNGNDSSVVFVDETVAGIPQIEGFDVFEGEMTFAPIAIQSGAYNLGVQ